MPKGIELTVELNVQKVSCPGVWLCQDGRVSLNVFALGTTYQTCMLPPIFPLIYKDVFYFRKRFQNNACNLNNICCLLKDETIYCELVQWCMDCRADECTVLAQYLGALNDVLFPPNMCTNDGVDLLMRRSKEFPGILSPKIEISTKMRVDEVWTSKETPMSHRKAPKPCKCPKVNENDAFRQKTVCHTPLYHRIYCNKRADSRDRDRDRDPSRCRSEASRSLCSISVREPDLDTSCAYPNSMKSRQSLCGSAGQRYQVFIAQSPANHNAWLKAAGGNVDLQCDRGKENPKDNLVVSSSKSDSEDDHKTKQDQTLERLILESHYIEQECNKREREKRKKPIAHNHKSSECTCDICRRYHELFNSKCNLSQSKELY